MQLAIRNKWISLLGSSVVKDLEEKDVLKVKGKFWTFTRKKFVQTLEGETKYIVRNRFWHFFVWRALICNPDKKIVATIRRKVFSFMIDTLSILILATMKLKVISFYSTIKS